MKSSIHSPLHALAHRYPQLLLPIQSGIKLTPEYKDAVLRGKPVLREPAFLGSDTDELAVFDTPAGQVEVLYLAEREDFEHALRALAYRCEPVDILPSVGASTISGLINWEKIRRHQREYLASGGADWSAEFKRFTAEKANYLDTLILLSAGFYSAVPAEAVGMSVEAWLACSRTIRCFHELTHFVCRKLYPGDRDTIRDEVLADAVGLIAAFGEYDPSLARMFLGLEDGSLREGGRLFHYATQADLPKAIAAANVWIAQYESKLSRLIGRDSFEALLSVFP